MVGMIVTTDCDSTVCTGWNAVEEMCIKTLPVPFISNDRLRLRHI